MTKMFIFVDLSYYVFYRFFAMITYYKMSKKELPNDLINDVEFLNKFDDLFEKTLIKVIKKHSNLKRITKDSCNNLRVVFGKDCCRENIWRNDITNGYKGTRVYSPNFDGRIFEHVYTNLIPKLLSTHNFLYISESHNAEADDVIAIMCKRLRKNKETKGIVIITNDNDYLQLLDCVTGIYNLQGYDLSNRALTNFPAIYNMLFKALTGDISDNIKGVCGKPFALDLLNDVKANCVTQNEEMCCEYIRNKLNLTVQEHFDLNIKLISFSCIPIGIQEYITNTYDPLLL